MATSRFIRFFSRRQPKPSQTTILNDDKNRHSNAKFLSNGKIHSIENYQQITAIKNGLVCTVIFLDGENVNFEVDRKAIGKNLYDKVFIHIKLVESDYFALQFIDTNNVKKWLDPTKSIKKQCKIGPPYTFRFRVKFYSSDPQNLHDELTRYLFVLQLKDDIRTGKLDCPSGLDVELVALNMQADFGDYTPVEHTIENVSEFRFLPDDKQTEEFEKQVLDKWATYKSLTPADSEIQYLNKARWLEMYGVDLHTVMGKDGLEYKLGLTPTGILVFENTIKIGLFVWSKITRIDFNRSKLTIVVVEDDDNDPSLQRDFVFLFRCYDDKQCKHFWKCALEYHIFYRTISANKIKQDLKTNFARSSSKFRFSGRTECQTVALRNLTNSNMNFERKASQRFSRRASYIIRQKIQEQEILREQEDERLRKLKSEQEAKLDENKRFSEFKSQSNNDLTIIPKRSSSQKNLNLSATQRLENLIQGAPTDLLSEETKNSTNVPPPVPPRHTKTDDKSTLSSISNRHSHPVNSNSMEKFNFNIKNDLPKEIIFKNNNENDKTLLIEKSPEKTTPIHLTNGNNRNDKSNSQPKRYVLANSQPSSSSYIVKETLFYGETTPIQQTNINNQNLSTSPSPLIVTRTLSQSNIRNACSTLIQSTNRTTTVQLPEICPRITTRSSLSFSSSKNFQSYHPITTEL